MDKQELLGIVVSEFAKDMQIDSVSSGNKFVAVAPNGAEYNVKVESKGRDYITDEPLYAKVVMWQGPVLIHSGSWFPSDAAITAAKAAVAAVRNTGYLAQGELL